ncbi:MAG TPA: hypothetical protein VF456_11390 [Vicinamibacterales bacterium]
MSIIRPCAVGLIMFILIAPNGFAQSEAGSERSNASSTRSIQFAPELRPDVDRMLQRSATFREQYRRIAAAGSLIVGVRTDVKLCETSFRARTTFNRYRSGLIVADVVIAPSAHPGEWIAHEFEHILELLGGRNLTQLASSRANDVWFSGTDVIETARASRAGRTVRDEVGQSDKAAKPAPDTR